MSSKKPKYRNHSIPFTALKRGHGKVLPLVFFGTFLRTLKSFLKISFLNDNLEFFKPRHPKAGIDIFHIF
jgi:hypothetical protein